MNLFTISYRRSNYPNTQWGDGYVKNFTERSQYWLLYQRHHSKSMFIHFTVFWYHRASKLPQIPFRNVEIRTSCLALNIYTARAVRGGYMCRQSYHHLPLTTTSQDHLPPPPPPPSGVSRDSPPPHVQKQWTLFGTDCCHLYMLITTDQERIPRDGY